MSVRSFSITDNDKSHAVPSAPKTASDAIAADSGPAHLSPSSKTLSAAAIGKDVSLDVPRQNGPVRDASMDSVAFAGIRNRSRSRSPFLATRGGGQGAPGRQGRDPNPPAKPIALALTRTHDFFSTFWARNKGVIYVAIAQFFNVLMNVAARILEKEGNHGRGLSPFQILFVRMGITVLLSSLYMWKTETPYFPWGLREVRWLLCVRSFGGFFGVFGMYYSIQYLPLSDATVITFLAPSLSCYACSLLINEPFTRMEQIGAYISIIGVVLIARPTSLFSGSESSDPSALPALGTNTTTGIPIPEIPPPDTAYPDATPGQRASAVLVALLGVFGAACAYTTIRWIGKRAHPLISVNYYAAWTTFVCLCAMLFVPSVGFAIPSTIREWMYLLGLGICGFTMQFLLAAGLQAEKSGRATNMVYTQMLFAMVGDKMVFGTSPTWMSLVGSGMILGSAIYVAVNKEKGKKSEEEGQAERRDEERGLVEGMDDDDEDGGTRDEERDIQLRTLRN